MAFHPVVRVERKTMRSPAAARPPGAEPWPCDGGREVGRGRLVAAWHPRATVDEQLGVQSPADTPPSGATATTRDAADAARHEVSATSGARRDNVRRASLPVRHEGQWSGRASNATTTVVPEGMASARQAAGGRPPAWLHGFGCRAVRSAGCVGSLWAARAEGIVSGTRLPAESSCAVGCHGHCRAIETARRQHRHGGGDCC